jgi:hypothetical protein
VVLASSLVLLTIASPDLAQTPLLQLTGASFS